MNVRAKFRVEEVRKSVNGTSIVMLPVTSGSEENRAFFKWTPSGRLEMGLISAEVAGVFVPGDEFYVDFSAAPHPEPK